MSNCYFCSLDDYGDIMRIHQSRFYIHNIEKTPAYYARFPTLIRSVLQGLKPDHKIIGYKPEGAEHMIAYAIVWIPKIGPYNAIKMSEVIKYDQCDFDLSITAWIEIADELARLGEAEDRLQFFVAMPLMTHLGVKRFSKTFKGNSNVMNKYNFLLFSVIGAEDKIQNPIEELMLSNYILPKIQNIAIIEISMMERYRLHHFVDRTGFKNTDMSKFVMNE